MERETYDDRGNVLSFQPRAKKFVSLMLHRGSEIPGDHPALEGDAALVRTMRLKDIEHVERHRESLTAVVRAWFDSKSH